MNRNAIQDILAILFLLGILSTIGFTLVSMFVEREVLYSYIIGTFLFTAIFYFILVYHGLSTRD